MTDLAGATVLITRPERHAAYLRDEVRRLGGRPIVFPTLDIEHHTEGLERDSFTEHDLAIFTSKNSVAAVAEYLESADMMWPDSLECAAVGGNTAALARASFGIPQVIAPTEDYGAALLMRLQSMQNLTDRRVIFFDGGGARSVILIRLLEDAGCEVITHAVVYDRVRPDSDATELQDILIRDGVDFVVITSVTAADNLIDMLDKEFIDALKHACMIVYSSRIEQHLSERGFDQIVVAKLPSDQAVLTSMIRRRSDRRSSDCEPQGAVAGIGPN